MIRRLVVLSLALLLTACASNQVTQDFDAGRDFAGYRSWSWQEPALQYRPEDPRIKSDLTEQRVRQAVAAQLDQRGLRPVAGGAPADLKVRVYLIVEDRQQQVTIPYGGAWGGAWGPYWGGPMYNETRSVDYKVGTLQIDLLDGRDGKLVWRASAEHAIDDYPATPQARTTAIQKTVAQLLSHYPPR
ncbi:DUF4136 domain-containing protein [Pseudomonas sp. S75]|uniref:DUF4136 domain-containing protein n=1 Tax=unclassified Pseudomonas TaxID=196821 RepID=UPI0019080EFF|nr:MULTISPECIES: DUF4136 domain-containing protein [unclassified Pseudomonas]MBJ9974708.1 DUF4136 domain-containing protein [Pseudomonas sp. S30]MBK0152536.1 DUF4136 domain-containing protein [Pseudomonas sp. S75]